MLDQLIAYGDKMDKICATFRVSFILGIIVNIIVITILFKLTEAFMRKLRGRFENNENLTPINNILTVVEKVIKFLIVFILAAAFLQSQGYSLTSLIAGFGITGLAVGFAAQQTIASIFGTFAILTDKVYKIGDYIKVNNIEGTVEKINLRSTKVRTLENFLVTIPNDTMADSVISNVSHASKRRLDMTFTVTYDTSEEKLHRAMDILKEIMAEHTDVYKEPNIFIDTLADSSINIRLLGYAKTKTYDSFVKIRSSIYMEAIHQFRQENISFAFPSQSVYIEKQ